MLSKDPIVNATQRPRRIADLATRKISDEETVVLSPSGSAIILNEVGAVVLELCDGTRTVDQVVAFLCESLKGANEQQVRSDVTSFVGALSEAGCLVDAP